MTYATRTRVGRCWRPVLQSGQFICHSFGDEDVRQSGVEDRQAKLDQPENGHIQRPSDDLDFGTGLAMRPFKGTTVQGCSLLVRHEAIGKALEFRPNKVCGYRFENEADLDHSEIRYRPFIICNGLEKNIPRPMASDSHRAGSWKVPLASIVRIYAQR